MLEVGKSDASSLSPDVSWGSCLACAWQTVTTVGYGGASTLGGWSNFIAAVVVLLSLVYDAIGIGVIYQVSVTDSNRQ